MGVGEGLEGFEVGYSSELFVVAFRVFFPGTFNIENRTNIDLSPVARPDPHHPRCVVVHLASADGADYVTDLVAVARSTKNRQHRTHPTTGSHRGREYERECPRKSTFRIITGFGIGVVE